MKFYLLGYPVEHSVSPPMHNAMFKEIGLPHEYSLLNVEPDNLGKVLDSKIKSYEFGGANVTIPHKIEMLELVDRLDESAKAAGAVNTLQWRDGILTGYNTDASGGAKALTDAYGDISKANLVILGAGGAANALAAYLKPRVENIIILNRSKEKAKALAERIDSGYGSIIEDQNMVQSADIILNATPIGMHPKVGASPIDKKHLNEDHMVFDIVYNPLKTQLMQDAERIGARTLGGLWMLVHQGAKAFQIWTGVEADVQIMYEVAKKALLEMHQMNIAIYGFMGVGKTTSGAILAKALGYEFIDMDVEIERSEGKSIPRIFSEDGEPRFRELERDLVTELSRKDSTVIGCGGGALADHVNAEKLRETSTLVYLTASVEEILRRTGLEDNRPLLNVDDPRKKIVELLGNRRQIYERYAEVTVDTTGKTPEQVAEEIMEKMPQ